MLSIQVVNICKESYILFMQPDANCLSCLKIVYWFKDINERERYTIRLNGNENRQVIAKQSHMIKRRIFGVCGCINKI